MPLAPLACHIFSCRLECSSVVVNQTLTLQSVYVIVYLYVFVSVCVEHAPWHPALSGWRVAVSWPVNQTLTLLVGCQNLNLLPTKHWDLILPHRHKVLQHQNQLLKGSNVTWVSSETSKTSNLKICKGFSVYYKDAQIQPGRPARCQVEAE